MHYDPTIGLKLKLNTMNIFNLFLGYFKNAFQWLKMTKKQPKHLKTQLELGGNSFVSLQIFQTHLEASLSSINIIPCQPTNSYLCWYLFWHITHAPSSLQCVSLRLPIRLDGSSLKWRLLLHHLVWTAKQFALRLNLNLLLSVLAAHLNQFLFQSICCCSLLFCMYVLLGISTAHFKTNWTHLCYDLHASFPDLPFVRSGIKLLGNRALQRILQISYVLFRVIMDTRKKEELWARQYWVTRLSGLIFNQSYHYGIIFLERTFVVAL